MKRYDLHPTRRRLLSGLAGLAALPTVAAAGPVLSSACPPRSVAPPRRRARGLPPTPELAVSLRALSQRLTARGQDRDQARALFGLTSVDGVMLAEDGDLVLWGRRVDGAPDLDAFDLAVALRVAHHRYGRRVGNVITVEEPAVSLDPLPEAMQRLAHIASQDIASGEFDALQQTWQAACSEAMQVRVSGLPRQGPAAVAIAADYAMKQVSQWRLTLAISPPLRSLIERRQGCAFSDRADDRMAMSRFWFESGGARYRSSPDGLAIALDAVDIALRDEDQRLQASGQHAASGRVDPYARAFATEWTARMDEILPTDTLWQRLAAQYRWFALARIVADRSLLQRASFDSELLLERYDAVAEVAPATLPGLGGVFAMERTGSEGSRRFVSRVVMPVCGGVSLAMRDGLRQQRDHLDMVRRDAFRVAMSRPTADATAWPVSV